MIRCAAIDDEPLALELLKEYIRRTPQLQLAQVFDDALSGREFLRNYPVDLLFIDINMPDISGLDLVRSLDPRPVVIFTTAYRQFAVEAYDLDAVDYLVKPVSFDRFERAVQKAAEFLRFRSGATGESEVLFVRSEYQLVKIPLDDIEYIESLEDYLKIHRREGHPVMTLMTMKAMQSKLPERSFRRIHRSYIVPLSRIRSVVNRKVRLSATELPIGDSYLAAVQEWWK